MDSLNVKTEVVEEIFVNIKSEELVYGSCSEEVNIKEEPEQDCYEEINNSVRAQAITNKDFQSIGKICKDDQLHPEIKKENVDLKQATFNVEYQNRINNDHLDDKNEIHLETFQNIPISTVKEVSTHAKTRAEKKPYECDMCKYKTAHKSTLISHIQAHIGEKPFKCKLCNYSSVRNATLRRHMHVHTGEKLYPCYLCTYKGSHKGALTRHLQNHLGEKPFKCKICAFESVRKSDLLEHMRNKHENQYDCPACNYTARSNMSLIRHMKIHSGEKPYECNDCNYKSFYKANLVLHTRIHTKQMLYECNICNYKGVSKSVLDRHYYRKHKAHKCSVCDFKSNDKASLIQHIEIHSYTLKEGMWQKQQT